ncbi:MAG: DUF1350 family protein [Jaaginema sp. PMC 1079.18]|nr:DUF1350 family protein [Jaaginema sp. PMC 1080.18]MEC4850747.1 DUF1350 family protein [Jaaginema sp. PMC 1079.18]MEC4865671.1 DUF1350 family protein [Jaaginema sp. PMC 1078.18]
MNWQEISGNWVILPRQPLGMIHFLGGALVGTAPHLSYRTLLEWLPKQGYGVIATPFLSTFDHGAIARQVLSQFESVFDRLQAQNRLGQDYLPIYGLGHSMGCKLHLLIGSAFQVKRAGNIFLAYNNYPAMRAVPFLESFQGNPALTVEFVPSPAETQAIIAQEYEVRRNLLIQFSNDDIDQTRSLEEVLLQRFPSMTAVQTLPGNHLTPLSQDMAWQTGDIFTPFDAIAQWFKQESTRDLNQLKREILRWLNPTIGFQ